MNKDTLSVEALIKEFEELFEIEDPEKRFGNVLKHTHDNLKIKLWIRRKFKESMALAQQETIQGVEEFYSYLNHQIRMIESHPQDFSNDEFIGMQNVRERFEEVFDNELSSLKEIKDEK